MRRTGAKNDRFDLDVSMRLTPVRFLTVAAALLATSPHCWAEGADISFRNDVMAVVSDGSRRDVSDLAVYEQSTDLAKITPEGEVHRPAGRAGETTVIVRYLQAQQPVTLAFVPARPDFKWEPVAAGNYVDEAVFE